MLEAKKIALNQQCHSWEDNEISRNLEEYLKRDGADVWIDHARLEGGDSLPEAITNGIEWCDTLVLVWSESAAYSYWVKEEWTCAHSLQKRIIPCRLDSSKLPSLLMSKVYINFNEFYQGYSSLVKALKLKVTSPETFLIRHEPKELSAADVNEMLKLHGYYDRDRNPEGKGIDHQYKLHEIKGDKVVFDETTGLMWQQSGSPTPLGEYSKNYSSWLKKLNQKGFAGFKDWRLPTLEEAMSLIEPIRKNAQYIDPLFDSKQEWIWTADQAKSKSLQWIVSFVDGICSDDTLYYDLNHLEFYVRAVRSVKII